MEAGLDESTVREELTRLEARLDEARVRGDAGVLGDVLSDEFRTVSPVGAVGGRDGMLADFAAGVFKVRSSRSTDLHIRSFGSAAVVSGMARLEASHGGHDVSGTYAYTHVYVKQDGRWQVVSAHSSRVMPEWLFFVAGRLGRLLGR